MALPEIDNGNIIDKVNKLIKMTGFDALPCLSVLRDNHWDVDRSANYIKFHRQEMNNILRYNRYGKDNSDG